MSRRPPVQDHAVWPDAPLAWLRGRVMACAHAAVLGVLALAGVVVAVLAAVVAVLASLGVDWELITRAVLAVRQVTGLTRRLAGEWCGVPIAAPYLPLSAGADSGEASSRQLRKRLLDDPATRRDLLWLVVNPVVGGTLAGGPVVAVVYGILGMTLPYGSTSLAGVTPHPLYGIALAAAGFWAVPWLLRGYGELAVSLLGPTQEAELAQRVRHLAQTRTETIDAGAAEVRRIERDLHDGAQARLVALAMNIGFAEQMVRDNPDLALTLLAEARASSGQALSELRALVHGIHPPVLAERGLDGAVRALALTLPLPVDLHIELPGRPPAPVESAAYFAIAETLANVVKHSGATRAWVQLEYDHGRLIAIVGDNGAGGAHPRAAGGLHGIERRLSAFDGTVAVTSPAGGPTQVTMELPCELSSAKT